AGLLLLAAKKRAEGQGWLKWLKDSVTVSVRQAQRYMRVADNWDEICAKCDTGVASLGLVEALHLLAGPVVEMTPKQKEVAECRELLPDGSAAGPDGPADWPEAAVRELTRIKDKPAAARAAAKVLEAVQQSRETAAKDPGVKPLAVSIGTVRKVV